jgi:hypothetical protein
MTLRILSAPIISPDAHRLTSDFSFRNTDTHRERRGRTIFVADAHRGDGKRLAERADEKLTAFLELEKVTKKKL